jgi:hypothetical protein
MVKARFTTFDDLEKPGAICGLYLYWYCASKINFLGQVIVAIEVTLCRKVLNDA